MKWLAALLFLAVTGSAAHAHSCERSLDYLLSNLAGDLPEPAMAYQSLLGVCLDTLHLSNVKDAYILKDGGIAVVPLNNSLIATAGTLADFCRQNPRRTLRFISPREARKGLTTGVVVLMSSTGTDPCQKILGQ